MTLASKYALSMIPPRTQIKSRIKRIKTSRFSKKSYIWTKRPILKRNPKMHWISRFNLEHCQASKMNHYTIHLLELNIMASSLLIWMINNGANHFQSMILKISKLKLPISKVAIRSRKDSFKMWMRNPKTGSCLKDRIIRSSLLESLLHKMRRTTMPQH